MNTEYVNLPPLHHVSQLFYALFIVVPTFKFPTPSSGQGTLPSSLCLRTHCPPLPILLCSQTCSIPTGTPVGPQHRSGTEIIWLNGFVNLAKVLHRMPILTQPSEFIGHLCLLWAWIISIHLIFIWTKENSPTKTKYKKASWMFQKKILKEIAQIIQQQF